MWPFFLTATYDSTKTLRSSPKAVVNLLHDSERLFRLHPLVISVEKNSECPLSYTLIDDLPVLGGHVTMKTTYTCTVQLLEDGVEYNIVAGLGTRSKNTFHVKKGSEDNVCELIERTTTQVCPTYLPVIYLKLTRSVQGFFLLMWYITRTQLNAHEKFRDNLQLALEGELYRQTSGNNLDSN